MQNFIQNESRQPIVFDRKIEDIPGGITVAVGDLGGDEVKAGTPVGKDSQSGLYHVVKTAKMQATANNSATEYRVEKGHQFEVGDIITHASSKAAYAIASIDTDDPDYDAINIGTTLGEEVAEGAIIFEAAEETADSSAFKYTPVGLVGTTFDIVEDDNHLVDCVVRGSVLESVIPPIHSEIKTALSLIRFV